MSIFTAKTFEPSSIKFAPVEKNKSGGRFVPLAGPNGEKKRLTLQLPSMRLPFGVSCYRENPAAEPSSYAADVSFQGMDENENLAVLYNKIAELEKHLLDYAVENSESWFGKKRSREVLDDTMRKLVKVDQTGKYAPTLKTKIPVRDGNPNVQVFDAAHASAGIENVPKGATVKLIVEIPMVWMISGASWGITLNVKQILVVSKPVGLQGFAFVADDGDEVVDTAKEDDFETDDQDLKFL
jgi:hypothetical protein